MCITKLASGSSRRPWSIWDTNGEGTQEAQEAQEKRGFFLCLLCFLCSFPRFVMRGTMDPLQFIRTLQFTDSFFPVGAFAYSDGLETATSTGHVRDAEGLEKW